MLSSEQVKAMKLKKGNKLNVLYSRTGREESAQNIIIELIQIKYKKGLKPEFLQYRGRGNNLTPLKNYSDDDFMIYFEMIVKEEGKTFNIAYQQNEVFNISKLD